MNYAELKEAQDALGDNPDGANNPVLLALQGEVEDVGKTIGDEGNAALAHQLLLFGNRVVDVANKAKSQIRAQTASENPDLTNAISVLKEVRAALGDADQNERVKQLLGRVDAAIPEGA